MVIEHREHNAQKNRNYKANYHCPLEHVGTLALNAIYHLLQLNTNKTRLLDSVRNSLGL